MEKTLTIRVSEADLVLWKEAAWVRKVSLSQWTRSVLTATAERTVESREMEIGPPRSFPRSGS